MVEPVSIVGVCLFPAKEFNVSSVSKVYLDEMVHKCAVLTPAKAANVSVVGDYVTAMICYKNR